MSNQAETTMSKQPVGITIKNEGQDAQSVVFARIDGTKQDDPKVVDSQLLEPGEEINTTLGEGLVVQISMPPQAANDESQSASGS
jgi:hypothetical protein